MTRLIDADKLKNIKWLFNDTDYTHGWNDAIDAICDNAPTVELFCSYLSDGEVKQPCVEAPCNHETQKYDDLCETCRYGDTCGQSDKGVSFAKHSWVYNKIKEADDDN